jgi:acid phosphatase class B
MKGKLTGMAKKDPWDREDFWEVMLDGFDQLSIPDQISFWRKALRRGRQLCSTPS